MKIRYVTPKNLNIHDTIEILKNLYVVIAKERLEPKYYIYDIVEAD